MSSRAYTKNSGKSPHREKFFLADVAQLVEQLICNQQVVGSMPIVGSIFNVGVAQLVEHGTENPSVGGSNPPFHTSFVVSFNARMA